MKEITQFSIIGENKTGELAETIRNLGYGGVNIRSISVVDRGDVGEIRMVVNDVVKAERIFGEAGIFFKKESVIAIRMADRPGSLYKITNIMAENGINIDYIYPVLGSIYNACVIFKTKDLQKTIQLMEAHDIEIVDQESL